jgi:hypothetical protein
MRRESWPRVCPSLGTLWAAVIACHHTNGAAPGRAGAEAADTVTGQVQVTGVSAFPRVVLVRDGGQRALMLSGPPSLGRVDGLRIAVVGTLSDSELTVKQFTVVAANGLPATDGRLVADGATLYLETADGVRHRLVRPSPSLRAHVGGRVWVSGPLDQEPVAYGVIE